MKEKETNNKINQIEKINQTEKINIAIEPELKKNFKIRCIQNNTEMSKVLKDFIHTYVNN